MKWFDKKTEEAHLKEDCEKDIKEKDENQDSEKDATPVLPPVSFFQLFRYSTPSEILLDLLGLVAAAGSGAAQPILALLFGSLALDFVTFANTLKLFQDGKVTADQLNAVADDFRKAASKNATFFVYTGIGVLVCTFFYMYVWSYTSEVNSKRIREHYLQSILKQDVEYFDELGAGEVVTRIQGDTDLVQRGISEKVPLCIQFTSSFIAGFILAFVRNWRLALAISSILPCITITGALMGKFMVRYTQLSSDATGSAGTISEESISTIRTAKAFNAQSHIGVLYKDQVLLASRADMGLAVVLGSGLAVMFFISYAAYGLAFSFGTTLINQGHADAGQVITVFMAIFIGAFSLSALGQQGAAIATACGAATKLFATIDRIPTIDSSNPGGDKPATVRGSIKFDGVSFVYPSRPDVNVLSDISLTFEAGKSYALVGPSGSGKSTVVSLLERFYDPTSGSITVDGADLKALNLKWLRRHIGLVAQEPVLFGTTVRNNVAHGLAGSKFEHASDEVKFELIKQACIKANAHDFIMRLPKGYNTVVGERGFMLSGGQKQRVAIARAIISDPPILLLDEATSALDTRSEELVQDALSKVSEGRTTVTIAHRLSTIRNSDKIYVMSGGKVVEEGSHDELVNLSGVYFRLVEAQGLKKQIGGTPTHVMAAALSKPQYSPGKNDDLKKDTDSEIYLEDEQPCDVSELMGKDGKRKRQSIFFLITRLGGIVKDQWLKYLVGIVASLISGLVYPAFGIVYAAGLNGFSDPNPHARRFQGDRNALWFFIISIITAVAMAVQNYCLASGAATLIVRLREMSFQAVMHQDVQFFDDEKNTSGGLTDRINSDPKKMNGIAGTTLGTIFQGLSTLVAGIVLGIAVAWKIGLVGMACIPFLLLAGLTGLFVIMLKDERNKKAHEQSAQVACESANAIRTVASLTREDGCLEEYSLSLRKPLKQAVSWGALSMFAYAFAQGAMFFVMALVFWYGSQLVSRLEISLFQLFIGLMATTFGALQAGGMFQFTPDVSAAATAAENIISLIDSPSIIEGPQEENSNEKIPDSRGRIEGKIEAKDVHFHYPMRPEIAVLQGLEFSVEAGQYVAFVGASGSGKSTIIQLIERFYDVTSGSIYIGDRPLKDLKLSTYRQDVALVSQEPTLYSGSIRFNILLGATKPHSEVTQQEIEEACRKANILDFIQGLPEGFETAVGNKGSQLSGGQKQRIAIARALVRDPKILLLDEATSALDTSSEKVVQAALDEAAKGRTTVAIAHRLSTIQDADKIFFIKSGRVSESGTHDELLSLHGDYYDYVQLQMLQQD